MVMRGMEHEEQEACLMFHNSYPCAYYVQSPSTLSHADSATAGNNSPIKNADADVSRFTLSRYSSSRGSNNSFLHLQQHDKKINHVDADPMAAVNRLIIIDQYPVVDHDDDDDYEYQQAGGGWWWRYCSYRSSNSCAWISLQIFWRLLFSFSIALLVFYIATKPPPPQFSIKMARVGEFGLGEGVDASGVTTKILTCNCSIHLLIDNKSKLFGLHIHPPILDISFQRLPPFAISRGPKLYAQSSGSSKFELEVGTRNKPMYGAGRSMEDLLDSGMGLPLLLRLKVRSNFRLVWNFIKPTFNHHAHCLLLLHPKYDHNHRTQLFNSTCTITTS